MTDMLDFGRASVTRATVNDSLTTPIALKNGKLNAIYKKFHGRDLPAEARSSDVATVSA